MGEDIDKKIEENFDDENKQIFKKENVGYIFIHGDKNKENLNNEEIEIDCYSFYSLGKSEYFDDEAMRKIHEIKIKDKD